MIEVNRIKFLIYGLMISMILSMILSMLIALLNLHNFVVFIFAFIIFGLNGVILIWFSYLEQNYLNNFRGY
jgi:hypothetical protein